MSTVRKILIVPNALHRLPTQAMQPRSASPRSVQMGAAPILTVRCPTFAPATSVCLVVAITAIAAMDKLAAMVNVCNLAAVIETATEHPAPANVILVSVCSVLPTATVQAVMATRLPSSALFVTPRPRLVAVPKTQTAALAQTALVVFVTPPRRFVLFVRLTQTAAADLSAIAQIAVWKAAVQTTTAEMAKSAIPQPTSAHSATKTPIARPQHLLVTKMVDVLVV